MGMRVGIWTVMVLLCGAAWAGSSTRVSVSSEGVEANGASSGVRLSGGGRYLVFISEATNLVAGDTNGRSDVFVHDRAAKITRRVSVSSDGAQANAASRCCSISADGRYVAFESDASNLVAGDGNGLADVFLHDRETGQTSRVAGGNGRSLRPVISGNGRFITYTSNSTLPGQTPWWNVYVYARLTDTTRLVSVGPFASQASGDSGNPSISDSGSAVAFTSDATNLVTGDGAYRYGVFVWESGITRCISRAPDGSEANDDSYGFPQISGDGRYVVFNSDATNLVNDGLEAGGSFIHDRTTGVTARLPHGGQPSSDGRYLTFASPASDLVPGDTNGRQDVFVHDRLSSQITRVSLRTGGVQANGHSRDPFISADGRHVAFASEATNLAPGDTNGLPDVFVHDLDNVAPTAPTTLTITPRAPGLQKLYAQAAGSTDANGDNLHYQYWWSRSTDGGASWEAWENLGRIVPANRVQSGEQWRVRARATDGELFSAWKVSGSVTILSMVAAVTPAPAADNVSQRPAIVVTFRWPVDQASAEAGFRLMRGATNLPGTFTWTIPNRKLKFVRPNKLVAGAEHTVQLLNGITLTTGRVLNWAETPCTFTTTNATPTAAAVTVAAAPTASGAQVTVNLASAATVQTVITNIAGRVVAELPERALPAGLNALLWNGRSNTGTRVPAGRYLVRVEARGEDGGQATALAGLLLR